MFNRSFRAVRILAAVLVVGLTATRRAVADGFIVIERPPDAVIIRPGPRPVLPRLVYMPLEVKNHNVTCEIQDTVGTTKIDQVFHNPNNQQMEGTYMFPLPETASVQKFSMWMNGREVHGELLDADKARSIYEDIVRRMKDPALLEYVGTRMYRARVFPIPANGDVRIALEYTETIAVTDGLATYRYPLNTEKFSSKDIDDVTISVRIRSQVPLKSVFCPSHNADISRPNDREARVGFEAHKVRPDHDFIVYYQMSEKEFGLSLLSYRPAGEDGYFMARIAPPLSLDAARVNPKDVCFVFDTSGSMAGDKIAQAKRAMTFCLSSLREKDRFNVIAFATQTRPFRDSLVPADRENIDAARDMVQRVEAAGGTNINEALLAAIEAGPKEKGDRPYMIVFITDGEPTINERDPAKIQANVRKANQGRCRLFVFGVGHDLNTRLLDRLAEDNGGTREYIDEKEDIEVKVSAFFRKVSDPILSDIQLRFNDAQVAETYPRQLPDLFHGSELVVLGRYHNPGRHSVTVSGNRAGERMTWQYRATFADGTSDNEFLPRLWATRKIGYLMDEIRLHGETGEVKNEIVRLATRYAIITPYTSYLVVEDAAAERRFGNAAPVAPLAKSLRAADGLSPAFSARMKEAGGYDVADRGRVGVRASEEAYSMQQADLGSFGGMYRGQRAGDAGLKTAAGRDAVKVVAAKTFYLDGERWIDSEYDGKAETKKIKAFSDEYFRLLSRAPDLGRYLSIGPRVIVVVDGTAYETGE